VRFSKFSLTVNLKPRRVYMIVRIVLHYNTATRRIETVSSPEGRATACTDAEKTQFGESKHGLNQVESIFETQQNPCYVVIGATKVEVPCP
jgi:hypothetical protein